MRVLEGLRILDFTGVLAGPIATALLEDLGTEVARTARVPTHLMCDKSKPKPSAVCITHRVADHLCGGRCFFLALDKVVPELKFTVP